MDVREARILIVLQLHEAAALQYLLSQLQQLVEPAAKHWRRVPAKTSPPAAAAAVVAEASPTAQASAVGAGVESSERRVMETLTQLISYLCMFASLL